jgi:antitoxin component YwqK of YwqJK toxin-antitoxin module
MHHKTIKAELRKQAKNPLLFVRHVEVTIPLRIRWIVLFLLTVSFLAASCVGSFNTDRYHKTEQTTEQNAVKSPDAGKVKDGLYRRWFPNSVLAEETVFSHGKRNGRHCLWYENGNRKLTASFTDDRLDGVCRAWYENGKPRLDIRFDNGKRTGKWIRTGEKVGVVARVSFKDDCLDGHLTVLVNRGYGNGSGRSLELEALFRMGQLVSSFQYNEADSSGNHLQLTGTILADSRLRIEGKKNLVFYPNGEVRGRMGDVETFYIDLDHFFTSKIKDRIMPMFTLEFCGIQTEMAPCPIGRIPKQRNHEKNRE